MSAGKALQCLYSNVDMLACGNTVLKSVTFLCVGHSNMYLFTLSKMGRTNHFFRPFSTAIQVCVSDSTATELG